MADIEALDVVQRARPLGFFAGQDERSDADIAADLAAAWRSEFVGEVAQSAWEYLALDRARVWTVDFTGRDLRPSISAADAVMALGAISGGAFRPTTIEEEAAPDGTRSIRFHHGSKDVEITGLLQPPIHFDLMLLARLEAAAPWLAFRVGAHEDRHHMVVLRQGQLPALQALDLTLLDPEDLAAFRGRAGGQARTGSQLTK